MFATRVFDLVSTTTAPNAEPHQRFDASTLLAREILSEIQRCSSPTNARDMASYLGAPLDQVLAALTFLGHVGLVRLVNPCTTGPLDEWEATPS